MRPDRPVVFFPDPLRADVDKRHTPPPNQTFPSHDKQVSRLTPQFRYLQEELENGRLFFTQNFPGIEPEFTLVFETVGNPQSIETAIRHFQETELISDAAENIRVPEDYYDDRASDTEYADDSDEGDNAGGSCEEFGVDSFSNKLRTKMFLVTATCKAADQIISLWKRYAKDEHYKFPRGLTGFRDLFRTLYSVHKWGISERLEDSGILEVWEEDLLNCPDEMIKIQIELFFRKSKSVRERNEMIVRGIVSKNGGTILDSALIPEIAYHALLAEIPRQFALDILQRKEVELVIAEPVMFLKSCTQTVVFPVAGDSTATNEGEAPDIDFDFDYDAIPNVIAPPLVALLDGLPQYNHPILKNLLDVDDPDNWEPTYPSEQREHGTSMASLILRGFDMLASSGSYRKVYVRPLMKPYPGCNRPEERIPDDFLLVRKFYRAISRLFDPVTAFDPGLNPEPPRAPSVKVVSLSLGIMDRQFYGMASPWARLLDWLSYKYGILFIVSAGNHGEEFDIGLNCDDFRQLSVSEKDKYVIRYLKKTLNKKHLLSPAESINALTVGASFFDNNNAQPIYTDTALCSDHMPAVYSSFDGGTAGCIKPDILYPGGRKFVYPNPHPAEQHILRWRESSTRKPGICSASPFPVTGSRCSFSYSFGTSNSAALISHQAQECHEVLNQVLSENGGTGIPEEFTAVLIKAMLVHGASWSNYSELFKDTLGLSGSGIRRTLHRYLGYGEPDIDRVKECTKESITFFGYGDFSGEGAFVYRIPVPFEFHEHKLFRRLTVTLAYISPVNCRSGKYRNKRLWFSLPQHKTLFEQTGMYDHNMTVKGTLQHQVFSGERVLVWDDDKTVDIKINAAGWNSKNDSSVVRYALFATFELAPNCGVDVYQKVLNRIAVKTPVTVKV